VNEGCHTVKKYISGGRKLADTHVVEAAMEGSAVHQTVQAIVAAQTRHCKSIDQGECLHKMNLAAKLEHHLFHSLQSPKSSSQHIQKSHSLRWQPPRADFPPQPAFALCACRQDTPRSDRLSLSQGEIIAFFTSRLKHDEARPDRRW
jgi:hypothetical protein